MARLKQHVKKAENMGDKNIKVELKLKISKNNVKETDTKKSFSYNADQVSNFKNVKIIFSYLTINLIFVLINKLKRNVEYERL